MIRAAEGKDAAAIRALDHAMIVDGRGEVRLLRDLASIEEIAARIARKTIWVAVADGKVVGNAGLSILDVGRCRHVASLWVGIHPNAQRQGHGRALVEYVIEVAIDAGVHRLELNVRADNTRAHALYGSLDFVIESIRRDFVRLDDGTYVDDLCMVRCPLQRAPVHRSW